MAASETSGQQPEQPTVVLPATSEQPAQPLPAWSVAASQPTVFAAQPAPARDLPAGVDPHELAGAPPASSRRGKLRRRLRYLRQVRELLLRDLGGFTYEVHRTAGGTAQEPQRRLAAAKAQRISTLDAELLALESRLGEPHAGTLLREPGIGGTCPECGELHASDAHFCSRCGTPLDEKARAQRATEQPATGSLATVEPQPASVLWAGGPRPTEQPAPDDEEDAPPQPQSEVTSRWLASDQPTTFERAPEPDEPAAERAEAKPEETAATADEPAAPADDAQADEAAPADDDGNPPEPTTAAARAKPKRAAKPLKPAAEPQAKAPEAETQPGDHTDNGRRDKDVPPPLHPRDPFASPREQP